MLRAGLTHSLHTLGAAPALKGRRWDSDVSAAGAATPSPPPRAPPAPLRAGTAAQAPYLGKDSENRRVRPVPEHSPRACAPRGRAGEEAGPGAAALKSFYSQALALPRPPPRACALTSWLVSPCAHRWGGGHPRGPLPSPGTRLGSPGEPRILCCPRSGTSPGTSALPGLPAPQKPQQPRGGSCAPGPHRTFPLAGSRGQEEPVPQQSAAETHGTAEPTTPGTPRAPGAPRSRCPGRRRQARAKCRHFNASPFPAGPRGAGGGLAGTPSGDPRGPLPPPTPAHPRPPARLRH